MVTKRTHLNEGVEHNGARVRMHTHDLVQRRAHLTRGEVIHRTIRAPDARGRGDTQPEDKISHALSTHGWEVLGTHENLHVALENPTGAHSTATPWVEREGSQDAWQVNQKVPTLWQRV